VVGVVTHGFLAGIVLVQKPEDVVFVEDAPDGGEGIAIAEVDAADFAALNSG
jgi:hypothetical protein